MINNETIRCLREMKLPALADAFKEHLESATVPDLSFEEMFGLMVQREYANRRNNRISRFTKKAGYKEAQAYMENIDYREDRKLDRALLTRMSSCVYISERKNVILLGASGSGKTYIGCALGTAANRHSIQSMYVSTPALMDELTILRGSDEYIKKLALLKRVSLLILDDWLLFKPRAESIPELYGIIDARYKTGSTIFCSQFQTEGWHQQLGGDTAADAICDRIIHGAITIRIEGTESMRKISNQ